MLGKYAAYMHIKDANFTDHMVVPVGFGDGNVPYILEKLFKKGYNSFLSLEPHLGKFKGLAELENGDIMKDLPEGGEGTFTLAFNELNKIIKSKKLLKVRLGVVGYGNMGTTHVRNIMQGKVPGMEIGAVCDISEARRKAVNEAYPEIPVFDNAEDLFKSGLCDAVIIAVYHYDHPALVIKAFEYGLHVITEKPAGVYTKQVKEMNDAACKRIAEIGYKTVQISGTPLEAKVMKPILDNYGLKVVTTHKGYDDFKDNLEGVIEYNRILGSDFCGLGAAWDSVMKSEDDFKEFVELINKVCYTLKKENMYFGYHNHSKEFVKLGGKTFWERFVEETDPETCNFIVDTYWVQVGGKNPADEIRKLGKRAMAVHFKDFSVNIDDWKIPCMCEVGNGNLDWDGIIKACDEAGTRWALVEQDSNWITGNSFESLEQSYNFLKTKGFN